jgi:peptidyl-tRNA hydrolase
MTSRSARTDPLRASGSDGGHNGLVSVIERLGTMDFPRLRMGVGPVPPRVDAAEFVLAEFFPEEQEAVNSMISDAVACAESWLIDGIGGYEQVQQAEAPTAHLDSHPVCRWPTLLRRHPR